jgi:bifunctional UDP-N-acetylglucosamine pyrophosphorylase / glucosamine-1-phosphate N-acetyltransferase
MSTRVMILAAGKGTRMGADVPKPLVKIAGRAMIEHLLDSIHDSEIDPKPIVIIAPDLTEDFADICRDDRCEFAIQQEQLGTGHAVQSAREVVNGAETIIILYGDHPFISPELITSLQELHTKGSSTITMITTRVPNFKDDYSVFTSWSRILRDGSGKVLGDVQVKDATEEQLKIKEVNPCLFAFRAEWLWEHLPEVKNKNASKEYYLTDLIAMAVEEGEEIVTTLAKPFEVVGINTKEELARAEKIFG